MGEDRKERSREELLCLLETLRFGKLSNHDIYDAIQAFGEMNFREAHPVVEHFLKSEDSELRSVALKVLTLYWHLNEYWEMACQTLLRDPDGDCRLGAAHALAYLKRDTEDRATLTVLARVVRNKQEEPIVRQAAYAAMRAVLHYNPREQWPMAIKELDFTKDIDWQFVDSYL